MLKVFAKSSTSSPLVICNSSLNFPSEIFLDFCFKIIKGLTSSLAKVFIKKMAITMAIKPLIINMVKVFLKIS